MRFLKSLLELTALLGSLLAPVPAGAQALTFVSVLGNDQNNTNPCTVQATPCRTLQRAVTATAVGGEISVLSQLPIQSATIAKSLTIEGNGHTMIGAIIINNASAVVTLRDLTLSGATSVANGLHVQSAAAVQTQNSIFERYTGTAVVLDGDSAEFSFAGSIARDSRIGLSSGATTLALENSRFENNQKYGLFLDQPLGQASVSESIASGNLYGFHLSAGSATFFETAAVENTVGFALGGDETLYSANVHGNAITGVLSFQGTARISNSVVTGNGTGLRDNNGPSTGTLVSLGNNLIAGNTTDVSGTLVPLAPQ